MASREQIQARLDELLDLRARGVRSLSYNGETIEYRSDAEMAAAIADLQRQLANLATCPAPRIFNIQGRKGYQP